MIYLFLGLSVGLFVICLKTFSVLPAVQHVVLETRNALALLRSKDMTEEFKESAAQAAAIRMFGSFFSILFRVGLCLGIPVGWVVSGSIFGFYQVEEASRIASSWHFIIGSTLLMVLAWKIFK